jgi:hypothetical protein
MRCERCDAATSGTICTACGRDAIDERIAYRDALARTVRGWREDGLVDDATASALRQRIDVERDALRAPAPVPRPETVAALTLPDRIENGLEPWKALATERLGWILGFVLTLTGSIYLAATVWPGLGALARSVLLAGLLVGYGAGFVALGSRLRGAPRSWLWGVAVALLPVLLIAAPAGWSLASAAIVLGLGLAIGPLLRELVPGSDRGFAAAYALASALLALPVLRSAWGATLVELVLLVGIWTLVRARRAIPVVGGLLAAYAAVFAIGFSFGDPLPAYAPCLALAGAALLYGDLVRSRWHGALGLAPRGLLGASALVAILGAGALVALTFSPLPAGAPAAVAALISVAVLALAAILWQRPAIVHGAVVAALVAVLTIPDLFHAIVAPIHESARHALGYRDTPLPFAWYALTLWPFLAALVALAAWLRGTRYALSARLSRELVRSAAVLSLVLLILSHTHGGDLRPALLAIPTHLALWLASPDARRWRRPLVLAAALVFSVDLGRELQADPIWAAPVTVAAVGALAIPLGRAKGAERFAALAAPAIAALAFAGTAGPAFGLAWLVAAVFTAAHARDEDAIVPVVELAIATVTLVGAFHDPAAHAWILGGAALAFEASTLVLSDRARVPARVAAHVAAALALPSIFALDDPARTLVKIPLLLVLVRWIALYRNPLHGALLVLGLMESAGRRAGLWLDPFPTFAIVTAVPVLVACLARGRWARPLGEPAAVLAALSLVPLTVAASDAFDDAIVLAPVVVVWLAGLHVFGRFRAVGELAIGVCALTVLRTAQDSSWIVLAAVALAAAIAAVRPTLARQAVSLWAAVLAVVSAGIVGFTELEGLAMLAGAWIAVLSVAVRSEWSIARGLAWSGPPLLALAATPRLAEVAPGWTVAPVLAIWAAVLAWGPARAPKVQTIVALVATIAAGLLAPTASLPLVWVVLGFALARHFHPSLAIPAIVVAALVPGDPLLGLVPAATYSLLRFVFRGRTLDLLAGALALDVALCIELARSSVVEPVAYVGTIGLTILVVAHLLRRTLDRDWAIVLRYGACGAIHLTAFATWIDDPHRTLAMVVLCLGCVAAGAVLRVRPYLFLGSAFLLATLAVNLIRFGLEHSEFWAFYLSALGLLVLAVMVVRSTARDRLHAAGSTIREGLATWE